MKCLYPNTLLQAGVVGFRCGVRGVGYVPCPRCTFALSGGRGGVCGLRRADDGPPELRGGKEGGLVASCY